MNSSESVPQSFLSLSSEEDEFLVHLSQQYGTSVPKLIERLHRNRVEAEMITAIEGITVEDFYSRTIAQIRAQLTEFE